MLGVGSALFGARRGIVGDGSRGQFLGRGVGLRAFGFDGRSNDVLAARLALGFVLAAGHVHLDIGDHLGMEAHAHVVEAYGLDRLVQDDLAAVEKAVQEAYGKVKSVRAKIVGETNMENPSFSLKGASTGSYEFARQGGKYYARTETKDSSETTMAG